jgi:hypothetical protein
MIGDIKHIIVIQSLLNERLTGEEIYNDCIRRRIDYQNKSMTHCLHNVHSKKELVEILKYFQFNASLLTGGILIHFEMHGDVNLQGLILSNRELIGWKELVELFRPINIITCNKLFITMATCNGRFLYKGVDPYQKSPYSGFISASIEVKIDEIVDKFSILFEHLIENGNLVDAYLEMEKTESNFYYKDSERTFEESYEMTMDELKNNKEYRDNLLKDIVDTARRAGNPEPDKEIQEFILKKVAQDMYIAQKKAFEFNDC